MDFNTFVSLIFLFEASVWTTEGALSCNYFGNKAMCAKIKSTNYTILPETKSSENIKSADTKSKILSVIKTSAGVSTMTTVTEGSTEWVDPHAKTEIETTIATATFLFVVATLLVLAYICKRCRSVSEDVELENGNKKWKKRQFKRFK